MMFLFPQKLGRWAGRFSHRYTRVLGERKRTRKIGKNAPFALAADVNSRMARGMEVLKAGSSWKGFGRYKGRGGQPWNPSWCSRKLPVSCKGAHTPDGRAALVVEEV